MTTIEDLIEFKNKLKVESYECFYKYDKYNHTPCEGYLLGIKLNYTYFICKKHSLWFKNDIIIKKFSEKDLFTLKIL